VVDYAKYDLDSPVPQEVGNGETTTAKAWLEDSKELTLRDLAEGPANYGMEFIGSADTMAGEMAEVMEEAGGDGFLMYPDVTRRSIMEVCDGLAPALRKRGLIRDGYAHKNFRDNLLDS
jgi:alkanesulfonate monooxygenase SsuD/methylene tetrahydromethanopterin reductase-like flavin-dependent oxidoreductase (luciferase family)